MQKYIEKNHGHWQLKNSLRKVLLECRAKESTRYAINGIHIGENVLVATDGRRLVEVQCPHKIEYGNYFSTCDGFLLNFVDDKFPNYQDIIPKKNQLRKIVEVSGDGENVIGLILGELCNVGCICKFELYRQPIEILTKIIQGTTIVFVFRNKPAEYPFIIEAETKIGHLRYIQMPLFNVKNEAKEKD